MAENQTDRTITILADNVELKAQIRVEGAMRGHHISEAALEALKLGLPLYLEQFPVKYEVKPNRSRKRA